MVAIHATPKTYACGCPKSRDVNADYKCVIVGNGDVEYALSDREIGNRID